MQDRNNELGETQEKWERETNAKPPPKPSAEGLLALLTFDGTLGPSTNAARAQETHTSNLETDSNPPLLEGQSGAYVLWLQSADRKIALKFGKGEAK